MSHPTKYFRQHSFRAAELRAEDPSMTKLDAELSAVQQSLLQTNERVRALSTSNGTPKYDVVSREAFTATASQTAFTLAVPYNTADDIAVVYSNDGSGNLSRIPAASVSNTSSTIVTIPAQAVGATVEIEILSPGNGNSALQSTTPGAGASLVGIEDSAGIFSANTVEDALAEVMGDFNTYVSLVGTLSDYIRCDGTNDFTDDQSMGGKKLTDLGEATDDGDAVRFDQVENILNVFGALSATYLALAGGTMSGPIDMDSNKLTNVEDGTDAGDAVNLGQLALKLPLAGGVMSGDIDMNSVGRLLNLVAPVEDEEPVRLGDLATLSTPFFNTQHVVATPGTTTFEVPAGITQILMEVWGGGGGGGQDYALEGTVDAGTQVDLVTGAGGGAAGGYGKEVITVVPGDSLSILVGAGGASTGTAGALSKVTHVPSSAILISASGGAGGANSGGVDAVSGAGGTSSAAFNVAGQRGGFHGGGNAPYGGGGGTMSQNGLAPGGGGGPAGSSENGAVVFGAGGAGRVVLTY